MSTKTQPNKPPRDRGESGFICPLIVESVDPKTWELVEDLVWVGSKGDVIRVSAGERTDFASVPQVFQSFIPKTGAWTKAAVVHDMLCRTLRDYEQGRIVGKPEICAMDADAIFEKIMIEDDVPPWKAAVMWAAVRWGALTDRSRREDWWKTSPRLARISGAVLGTVLTVSAAGHWGVDLVVPW